MAGDWIKVEIATSRKAEVLRMAEMLGVSRRECMGLLVDYWAWLDANARTESVPNLSRKSLDDVLNCAGLAACLEAVGWASWSADGWTMRVSNYEHHNSASAKTRAYEQKKKRAQRDNSGTKPGPEKRREEIDTSLRSVSSAPPKKPAISEPSTEHRNLAATLGVPCDAEFEKYRDWLAANGRKQNQDAGFRNWLRKAAEFRRPGKQSARDAVAAQIFGATNERTDERVIDGEVQRVA